MFFAIEKAAISGSFLMYKKKTLRFCYDSVK